LPRGDYGKNLTEVFPPPVAAQAPKPDGIPATGWRGTAPATTPTASKPPMRQAACLSIPVGVRRGGAFLFPSAPASMWGAGRLFCGKSRQGVGAPPNCAAPFGVP